MNFLIAFSAGLLFFYFFIYENMKEIFFFTLLFYALFHFLDVPSDETFILKIAGNEYNLNNSQFWKDLLKRIQVFSSSFLNLLTDKK